MKKLLSLLMCYVFLQAETFALRGGPNNTGGQKVSGSYSGAFIENDGKGSDLGLFLLNAVGSGASSGQVVIFASNPALTGGTDTYFGTLTGLSDTSKGGSGKFYGLFSGSASTGSGSARSCNGQLTVNVATSTGRSLTQRLTGTATSQTVSVSTGTSNAATDVGPVKSYSVDGWLTSSSGASFTPF